MTSRLSSLPSPSSRTPARRAAAWAAVATLAAALPAQGTGSGTASSGVAPVDTARAAEPETPEGTRRVRILASFALSPNGTQLAFSYLGDLWTVSSEGGMATRLTHGPADDSRPLWSPDGERLAFSSNRDGEGTRIWIREANGSLRRLESTLRGEVPLEWTSDGKALLVNRAAAKPFRARELAVVAVDGESAPRRLFRANARAASISPDGKRVLFVRRGRPSSRRGYYGPAAGQLWLATLGARPSYTRISPDREDAQNEEYGSPMWLSDSEIAFVHQQNGVRNLVRQRLVKGGAGDASNITTYGDEDHSKPGWDDGVEAPSLARVARTVAFRKGFRVYTMDLRSEAAPRELVIHALDDSAGLAVERRSEKSAQAVAWLRDGKECAFVAGGDLWVMDRILREPVRVTSSAEEERSPLFDHKGERLYFSSDRDGHKPDLWVARRKNPEKPWFQQEGFTFTRLTDDPELESSLAISPDGERLSYVRGGALLHTDLDGKGAVVVDQSWDTPSYDWSPDGKYLVFARNDADFNNDVWIAKSDGSGRVVNLSRHPDNDRSPIWSPDGARIAWTGRREDGDSDVFYVNLDPAKEEETERERKLEKALAAFKKKSKKKPGKKDDSKKEDSAKKDAKKSAAQKKPVVKLVLDELHERIHRVRVSGSEGSLLWSHDGKALWFRAMTKGKSGVHEISFPDKLRPSFKYESFPSAARVLPDKTIVGHVAGTPASFKAGKIERFPFDVRLTWDWRARRVAVLRQVWRVMHESFYDPAMNNKDWTALGERYTALADECLWPDQFELVANTMLGELNASHMGYRNAPRPGMAAANPAPAWRERLYSLGVVVDPSRGGPGLYVERAVRRGPARRIRSRIHAGERIVRVDEHEIRSALDLDRAMLRREPETMQVTVRDAKGKDRTFAIDPISEARAAALHYGDWVQRTRKHVEATTGGAIGYLHIRGMNMSSFSQLEEDIYAAGHGKDGLLIDVRWNGGGSTADHVLTVLCQPEHAMTIPRGGNATGYPQDRRVYATWNKPIVLLCNERSFSNAEILSHAVKNLGRGRVVGERTAGGVISTGGARLMDGSFMRRPFRAWFVKNDGADMELAGAMPDIRVQITPADEDAGHDPQLDAAIRALFEDLAAEAQREKATPRYRSQDGKR